LHQKAIRFQAVILGKRGQRRDGMGFFHISTNIELWLSSQGLFR
jgi:hypothetical protein